VVFEKKTNFFGRNLYAYIKHSMLCVLSLQFPYEIENIFFLKKLKKQIWNSGALLQSKALFWPKMHQLMLHSLVVKVLWSLWNICFTPLTISL